MLILRRQNLVMPQDQPQGTDFNNNTNDASTNTRTQLRTDKDDATQSTNT